MRDGRSAWLAASDAAVVRAARAARRRAGAARMGVDDYRNLVDEKLRTVGQLYEFMVDQFNQSRAFVLELMVVIILVIELVYFFRGKPI